MSTTGRHPSATLALPEGAKSLHDTLADDRFHIVLGLSPEVNRVVEELALRYGGDKGEVFNLALGILKHLSDAAAAGKKVGIASPEQELETEITGL